MTDFKASIEIKFSIFGETRNFDAWINYDPESSHEDGVDRRVAEWFKESYEAMYAVYMAEQWKAERKEKVRLQELQERRDYERLKAKFEPEQPSHD